MTIGIICPKKYNVYVSICHLCIIAHASKLYVCTALLFFAPLCEVLAACHERSVHRGCCMQIPGKSHSAHKGRQWHYSIAVGFVLVAGDLVYTRFPWSPYAPWATDAGPHRHNAISGHPHWPDDATAASWMSGRHYDGMLAGIFQCEVSSYYGLYKSVCSGKFTIWILQSFSNSRLLLG